MPLEDVESPPYPNEGTTAQGMFNYLKQLRKWVLHYRDDTNATIGQEVIPSMIEIPNKTAYTTQPVFTHYQHLMMMRHFREQWDHLIRCYESDWCCKQCLQARTMLVQASANLINGAFTPFEVREARAQQHIEHMQQSFARLTEFFKKVMEPDEDSMSQDEPDE